MLFNVETDRGVQIVGYVVPDGFSGSPTLRVTDGERIIAWVSCNEPRPALVAAGRHANGLCGFSIDESTVADLQTIDTLEIYDEDTGILIYRRRPAWQLTHHRVFRLETHLFPLWPLDDAFERSFQFFHKGVERHGRETATQVFMLLEATSVYLSGRLPFKAYEDVALDSFSCVTLMQDPYMELSERLLTLRHIREFGSNLLGARDMVSFEAAIEFAQEIDNDEKSLRRLFARIPRAAINVLSNPTTRLLSAESFDEAPRKNAVATALNALSGFAVVGLRKYDAFFVSDLELLLGAPPGYLPPMPQAPAVATLAGLLRRIPEAELLLEHDLEIYETVRAAVELSL